jgi:hypothetical protein
LGRLINGQGTIVRDRDLSLDAPAKPVCSFDDEWRQLSPAERSLEKSFRNEMARHLSSPVSPAGGGDGGGGGYDNEY